MATREDMLESNYIQKTDLPQPTRLTIAGCVRDEVMNNRTNKKEAKWIVSFEGKWKPLILNVTNTNAFFDLLGNDSVDWVGKQVILFNDEQVMYEGKKGGIRVYRQMEIADAQPQFDENGDVVGGQTATDPQTGNKIPF